jgi:hypothetical protein
LLVIHGDETERDVKRKEEGVPPQRESVGFIRKQRPGSCMKPALFWIRPEFHWRKKASPFWQEGFRNEEISG